MEEAAGHAELDARAKLLIKDMQESLLLKTSSNHKAVFISEVACRLGFRFTRQELGKIGHPIAKRFKLLTGTYPSKHLQFVDGHSTYVNSYTQDSEHIVKEELRKAWTLKQNGTQI